MLRKLHLWLLQITLVGGLWLHCATAWAQDEAVDEGGKSYVLAYVLVGFVVVLAMMVVCRGTSRLDKPKMVEADLKHKLEQLQAKK
ncbi:MAG: hypothetical protein OES79_05970 [Planctomycetota bacterium]|nr:hypothetical protein [Planctomycetota bacterium]